MTHKNWNYDNSGNAVVPADAPMEHTALVAAIENSDGPNENREVAADFVGVPIKRNVSGLPDWDRPRNEQGQYITKSAADRRAQWDKEGGYATNAAKVVAVESAILSASENPAALQSHIATLPNDLQLIAADHLRLATGYGRDAGARKFEQFCDSLSPAQLHTFGKWWRGLSRGDQDAILGSISL